MSIRLFLLLFSYLLSGTLALAELKDSSIITLRGKDKIIAISVHPYYIFEDKQDTVSIKTLLNNPELFIKTTEFLPENKNRQSTYWVKIPIIDSSSTNIKWIFELYNYRIDSLELYVVHKGKIILTKIGGDHYLFAHKDIPHKNFAYLSPSIKNDTIFYYIKGKSNLKIDFFSVFKSIDYFVQYSNSEYYLLGMLYGVLVILLLYNIFYLIIFRELLYFYYLLSIVGFIIYFMSKDGTGFQYLWYSYPAINNKVPSISLCFAIINQLLFTKFFFQKNSRSEFYQNTFYVLIAIRILYLAIELISDGKILHLMVIDIPLILVMLWISIKNIQKSELGTFYFPLGVSLFLIGFSSTAIYEANSSLLTYSTLVVYGSTIGVVAQISAFWGSLSFRHRQIVVEQKISDYQLQLKNIEFDYLKKYKKELEIAVHEATQSLEKKSSIIEETNKNLETFIYKTSHNLRGPLSSIMGLYTLSLKEHNETKLKELLQHINTSTVTMDQELILVSKAAAINSHEITLEKVNLIDLTQNEFDTASIQLNPNNRELYTTNADRWLVEEVIKYIKAIYLKLTNELAEQGPTIEISTTENIFTSRVSFKCPSMKVAYIEEFFTPFHKDISHIYGLYTEPYLCHSIMVKLRGKISIELEPDETLIITLRSRY